MSIEIETIKYDVYVVLIALSDCLDSVSCVHVLLSTHFNPFFFLVAALVDFLSVNSASVYCSQTHKFHFLTTFSSKMGFTALFTHLKIILLQCF